MDSRKATTYIIVLTGFFGMMSGSGAAFAQAGAEDATGIEEIVVTARRRTESLQDTPLSITAITSGQIEDEGIESIDDVALRTPGFSYRTSFGRQDFDRPTIRGQSNILGDPNASFFIDGVFVNGSITTTTLDNIERIEVIKGPQAAMFGRATFAGAVNLVTKLPSDEFEGKASLTVAQDDDYRASISLSGPIIEDKLSFFLGANGDTFDGQFSAPQSDGSIQDVGGQETTAVDAMLYATPTDNLTIKARASYSDSDDGMYIQSLLPSSELNFSVFDPVTNPYSPGYFQGKLNTAGTIFPSSCIEIEQLSAADGDPVECGVTSEILRLHLVGELDIGGWTLTQSIAVNDYENRVVVDADYRHGFGLFGFLQVDFGSEISDRAFETRLASPADRRIRGQVGFYDYHEDEDDLTTRAFSLFGVIPIPGTDVEDVDNRAFFASIEADLTDQLTASLEARYAKDERTLNEGRPINIGAGTPEAFDVTASARFYSFAPRATLAWAVNEDANVYVYVAKGNKPGGFNTDFFEPLKTAAAFQKAAGAGELTVDEEEAWTFEIGAKTTWLDNRLALNVSAYYIDWDNQQLTSSRLIEETDGVADVASVVLNIGKSEVQGFEVDAAWQASERLTLSGTLAYTDASIKQFTDLQQALLFDFQDGTIDFRTDFTESERVAFIEREGSAAGNRLPNTSEWQFSLSAAWEDRLGDTGWDWFARADLQVETSRFAQIHNLIETGDSQNVNLRIGARNDRYSITAWVANATDDDTATTVTRGRDFFATRTFAGDLLRGFTYALPRQRQIGITATVNF